MKNERTELKMMGQRGAKYVKFPPLLLMIRERGGQGQNLIFHFDTFFGRKWVIWALFTRPNTYTSSLYEGSSSGSNIKHSLIQGATPRPWLGSSLTNLRCEGAHSLDTHSSPRRHFLDSRGSGSGLSVPENSDFGSDQGPTRVPVSNWKQRQRF